MSLFVRSLTRVEGNHIQRILRHGKSRTPFRRAQVIIHSAHGYTVQEIAKVTCLHEEYIRELIRRFNKEGRRAMAVDRDSQPHGRSFTGRR
jgi:transposase